MDDQTLLCQYRRQRFNLRLALWSGLVDGAFQSVVSDQRADIHPFFMQKTRDCRSTAVAGLVAVLMQRLDGVRGHGSSQR